jgi:hypothetical protein
MSPHIPKCDEFEFQKFKKHSDPQRSEDSSDGAAIKNFKFCLELNTQSGIYLCLETKTSVKK